MGISGYEAFVMSTVSPFLLGIPPLRRLVIKNVRIVHLLGLAGVAAWLVDTPSLRLATVGFGVWTSTLAWAATFYAERSQPHRLEARVCAFAIGLIASSVAKYAFWTNNPIWPTMHADNGGWNKIGLLLAVLAVLRSTRTRLNDSKTLVPVTKQGFSLPAALGLAGLLFGMHSLLSDSSTMILWVWEGFPVQGPLSVPHGSLTILAMSTGLVFGLFYPTITGSWTAFGLGSLAAATLTTRSHWIGFYGALGLAFYLMALAPILIASASRHGPASIFGLGFIVYNFMVLFHVWVVAYAFVPGGPLVREHTDWIMFTMMLLIAAGVFSNTSSTVRTSHGRTANPAAWRTRSYYIYILGALQLLSVSVSFLRFPSYDYTPYHPSSNIITAGIWTIHFGLDNPMWDSTRRMRDLIKEMELDLVGLLESDTQRIIMGNRDTTQYLAEDLGMYVDYGPGPNKHTWGCALLSKFPIINSTHHLLPSPVGELAPAIHATVDAYGTLVDVFVFHSGQEEDPEDRRLQSLYLADLMKNTPRPAILLSYLVIKPGEGNYNNYVGAQSGMKDIDSTDWDRWCEYILFKGLKRTGYARVSRSTITDTELQVGKFQVGQPESVESGGYVSEMVVPEDMRFPAMFKGQGVRGHQYHVSDEPR
jgi:endonuclease/exonuclease/phosphatase family metal-dependent hydrolase